MKKSFLKRVTAAVIALPVALSQTVLFASFAAGESNAVEAINIDSFLTVPAGQALYEADSQEYKALGARQTKDANANYRYFIQESVWNAKVTNALNSYSGETFEIDATSFANYISDRTWFGEMIKKAFADPVNKAYANIYSDGVDVVADVNYSYEKFAMDILNRSIPQSYKNVEFTFESDGIVDATVTISGDTTALGGGAGKAARTIPYTVEIDWDGQKLTTVQEIYEKTISVVNIIRQDTKDSVAKVIPAYEQEKDAAQKALDDAKSSGASAEVIAEKQADLDAKTNRLDNANRMVEFKVDEIFDNYVKRITDAKERYDNQLAKDIERDIIDAEDVDAVLAKLDTVVENNIKNKKVNNAFPASLAEFRGGSYYDTVNKIFNNVLEQINNQTAEKTTSGTTYSINMTVDEILDKAAEVKDITAYGKHVAGQETVEGYAYGYLEDNGEDADLEKIEKLINEKLAAEGLELKAGSLYTIKAIEVDGNGGIQDGTGTLDIYRIIRFETVETQETTTSTEVTTTTGASETDSSETTTSAVETGTGSQETTTSAVETGTGSQETTTNAIETGTGSQETTTNAIETGTGSQETTTNAIETGTGSQETTTTASEPVNPEETTTTASEPVNPEETTTSTESTPIDVETISIELVANENFYFAHDPNAFEVSDLIDIEKTFATDQNGKAVTLDVNKFTFGLAGQGEIVGLSPKDIYDDRKEAYNKVSLLVFYNGEQVKGTADVYIGVKGDANLNGEANAEDAAKVLEYAARSGAGDEVYIFTGEDATLDKFAFFLADTTDESKDRGIHSGISSVGTAGSKLDATDAANILVYASKAGANGTCDWIPEVLLTAPYPKYSETIAEKAGLIPSENQ